MQIGWSRWVILSLVRVITEHRWSVLVSPLKYSRIIWVLLIDYPQSVNWIICLNHASEDATGSSILRAYHSTGITPLNRWLYTAKYVASSIKRDISFFTLLSYCVIILARQDPFGAIRAAFLAIDPLQPLIMCLCLFVDAILSLIERIHISEHPSAIVLSYIPTASPGCVLKWWPQTMLSKLLSHLNYYLNLHRWMRLHYPKSVGAAAAHDFSSASTWYKIDLSGSRAWNSYGGESLRYPVGYLARLWRSLY